MKTVLFTFDDDAQRVKFIESVKSHAPKATMDKMQLDPQLKTGDERTIALFVSGVRIIDGTLSAMQKRFEQEVASHSGTVEIKELRGNEWKRLRIRRNQ